MTTKKFNKKKLDELLKNEYSFLEVSNDEFLSAKKLNKLVTSPGFLFNGDRMRQVVNLLAKRFESKPDVLKNIIKKGVLVIKDSVVDSKHPDDQYLVLSKYLKEYYRSAYIMVSNDFTCLSDSPSAGLGITLGTSPKGLKLDQYMFTNAKLYGDALSHSVNSGQALYEAVNSGNSLYKAVNKDSVLTGSRNSENSLKKSKNRGRSLKYSRNENSSLYKSKNSDFTLNFSYNSGDSLKKSINKIWALGFSKNSENSLHRSKNFDHTLDFSSNSGKSLYKSKNKESALEMAKNSENALVASDNYDFVLYSSCNRGNSLSKSTNKLCSLAFSKNYDRSLHNIKINERYLLSLKNYDNSFKNSKTLNASPFDNIRLKLVNLNLKLQMRRYRNFL